MASTQKTAADAADDLDDLDDILDEFNAPAQGTSEKGAASTSAGLKAAEGSTASTIAHGEGKGLQAANGDDGDDDEDELNDRFARELAQGMEAMMRGMDPEAAAKQAAAGGLSSAGAGAASSGVPAGDGENLFDEQEMMKQFEQMMADMGLGGMGSGGQGAGPSMPSASAPAGASASQSAKPGQPANFQDAIRSTMSRLRESDASATTNASGANEMDFDKLLAAMSNAEGGEGGEEGIANMLESMMNELMSKDVLYEPLTELRDKYPGYLSNPPAGLSAEDRARYEKQHDIVKQVIATFDDPKYENGTASEKQALKDKVQNLMNAMQDNGAPPPEIVGDLPPELGNLPGLGGNDENCTVM